MTIGNTIVNDKKLLFESVLIKHIAKHDDFMNDYDRLALYLSADSGKNIDGRKITYMSRGEAYAKKLADMSGKPECIFEQKYTEMLQESQYGEPK
jgi:hypothetical protein